MSNGKQLSEFEQKLLVHIASIAVALHAIADSISATVKATAKRGK
jgi:hypothetical protein